MNKTRARQIVKFIRSQTSKRDLKDILVDRYEIGYDDASLLIMLADTNF